MTQSLRRDAPDLWRDIVGWCREIGIDWPEDEIANVIGKIHARTPDALPDTIGRVLEWCCAAESSDDEEIAAVVSLWRELPNRPDHDHAD
ncbi:hypothetical protein [Pontitalea aquivivens]|uniref:hypothetical protein n=1 Tax=Pontitalea aquivivens TaxID=3388663 RepID=UPI003971042A